jgi:organic radical activating enzyme
LYDLDKLPTITGKQLRTADVVCLTGGEPFLLDPWELVNLCENIRRQYPNIKKLYVYTSGTGFINFGCEHWERLLESIDGLNISPKCERDWSTFHWFNGLEYWVELMKNRKLSNRLYLFEDQIESWEKVQKHLHRGLSINWNVIGRKWDKEFNTPENEHFVRLPILY